MLTPVSAALLVTGRDGDGAPCLPGQRTLPSWDGDISAVRGPRGLLPVAVVARDGHPQRGWAGSWYTAGPQVTSPAYRLCS